ncbi:MAG: right-handed parallel beta-helix repeat-containing protein [Bacteroidetes bacterium]|nr:right-handed parallel beta-helix repeat-containing protein [Bacteroidota bacterium]
MEVSQTYWLPTWYNSSYHLAFKIKGWLLRCLLLLICSVIITDGLTGQDIYVGGNLEQDEVWTSDHTYIVTQDLKIQRHVTLTIEPGVQVKINQGRGIFIYGSLIADGQADDNIDSINFVANHLNRWQNWKWKGLIYIGVKENQENILSYVNLSNAETAIDIYVSNNITIQHARIYQNQVLGIAISNSQSIIIEDCWIQENYDGIEIVSESSDTTSNVQIRHCNLKNANHNIYLYKKANSILAGNTIFDNHIEGANNGIWMDNGGGISEGINSIERNIIINNGNGAGYGLLISLDSVVIKNNIFWKNHIGISYEQNAKATNVLNNSFYQNYRSVILSEGSVQNSFINNTFTVNEHTFSEIGETEGTIFDHNNFLPLTGQENIVSNTTADDIFMGENFWNTIDEAIIHSMIWDQLDDPALGIISFLPVLPEADTTSPISPPLLVKKQLVNNEVKLSWPENPELDISAYKVYYGEFENYLFSNQFETGADTSLILAGVSIDDSIAVTALDYTSQETGRQVMGHESPYAFAVLYPYAGSDSTICKSVTAYKLNNTSVPFTYQNITWTTDGDGTFNNTALLQPIYYPGPMDVENGLVNLQMNVQYNGKNLSDDVALTIIGDPVVFAGNDTIVFMDSNIELVHAFASNYDQLNWTSSGDGQFDTSIIVNPTYTPGPQDLSETSVDLIFMAESECGSAADTITILFKPFYSVEGRLWHLDQNVSQGMVIAIQDDDHEARAVKSTTTNTEGYFIFDKLFSGNYYVYAVPDTNNPEQMIPAYYVQHLKWQDAYKLQVDADVYDIDIHLPVVDYILPIGEASISGHFVEPAGDKYFSEDVFCRSWFEETAEYDFCDGGVSNITVFLYNSDATKILDFTLTDINGNFYFNNLPFGSYLVDAEKTGFQTTISPSIWLSPDHQNETGITLEVSGNKIGIYRNNEEPATDKKYIVYPNPATKNLNVMVLSEELNRSSSVQIFNIFGQMVLSIDVAITNPEGYEMITLSIQHLACGVYVGLVGDRKFTFIKN